MSYMATFFCGEQYSLSWNDARLWIIMASRREIKITVLFSAVTILFDTILFCSLAVTMFFVMMSRLLFSLPIMSLSFSFFLSSLFLGSSSMFV